jgi:DNA repair protein RecN (Recombination protein N)
VRKDGDGPQVASRLERLTRAHRLDELARMLGGSEVTAKTRAHAKELFEQSRREGETP